MKEERKDSTSTLYSTNSGIQRKSNGPSFKIHEMIRQTSDNFLVCDNVKWNQIACQIEEPLNIIKHNQTWIFVSYQPMWLTLREYIRILIDNFVIKLSTR